MFRFPASDVWKKSHRTVVTVMGTITELDPDQQDHQGARHQILTIRVDEIITAPAGTALAVGDEVNLAFRFGDGASIDEPVADLAVGEPITVQGAFVPEQDAYGEPDGDRKAVIHFTHRPLGWVEYHGRHYE
ncbi:MAG TPA: hypothetical protein VGK74_07595 [Symbiobacteriaceae bacterium]|jgi:hypothetical protein